MAQHSLKSKYYPTQRINYRTEDDIINEPLSCMALECTKYKMEKDGLINLTRKKRDTGIQFRHQMKDEIKGYIPKPVAQPEYGTVYKHQGMLLQNLHRRYLYIVIRLPKLEDLDQRISNFPECDNYGI